MSSAITIALRANEGCAPQPILFWDSVWDPTIGFADWALAGSGENASLNAGGLRAETALTTAVILCLFTDRWCPPDHPLARFIDPNDPRGWWGDGVDVRTDLGEASLGSLLWTLQRSVVTDETINWAQALAIDALQPMIGQMSVVEVAAQAYGLPALNRIDLAIQLYGRNGAQMFNRRFDDIWSQFVREGAGDWPAPPTEGIGAYVVGGFGIGDAI